MKKIRTELTTRIKNFIIRVLLVQLLNDFNENIRALQ